MATLLIFIAVFASLNVKANPVADNVADFQLLCQLAALAEQEVPTTQADNTGQAAYMDIEALNMSASDEAWQNLFSGKEPHGTWAQKSKDYDGKDFQADWATKWDNWNKAKATITSGTGSENWLAKHPPPKNTKTRKQVAAQLKTLADRASHVYHQQKTTQTKDRTETLPAVHKALREALYGTGTATKKAEDGKTVKAKSDYDTSCKTTGPRLSLYGDLLCICGLKTVDRATSASRTASTSTGGGDATAVLQAVQKKCPKQADSGLTASNVEAAITAFGTRVRHTPNSAETHHFLGKQAAGTCDGTSNQLCVVYDTFYATNSKEGHLAIPWVAHLTTAVAKLREYEAAVADIKDATAAIKQLQAMAWTIYSIPDTDEAPVHQVTPKEQLQKTQQACDQHKSNKTTCESTGKCEWKAKDGKSETEGECKPKEGEEQKSQGTGEGTAGADVATTGCARHGTEKAKCETNKSSRWKPQTCENYILL
uniref:Variant surface glycoprotein 1125.4350 n=1 Tax=Trypanosoma brucei TaxID=5691 RepID=A0A1J0RAT3_9TRYP|nr:variant surface glycoprotein 1125.4350 [Trypanosoma brucei]